MRLTVLDLPTSRTYAVDEAGVVWLRFTTGTWGRGCLTEDGERHVFLQPGARLGKSLTRYEEVRFLQVEPLHAALGEHEVPRENAAADSPFERPKVAAGYPLERGERAAIERITADHRQLDWQRLRVAARAAVARARLPLDWDRAKTERARR